MNSENYIVIDGKKAELTNEQINSFRIFEQFAKMAKEQFGLTITSKETTGETFKTLFGTEVEPEHNNPFNRKFEYYHFISSEDAIEKSTDDYDEVDQVYFNNANYFNDKNFANQVMLHQQLYRKLLKYAYDNNAEVTEKDLGCDNDNPKYFIYCELYHNTFYVDSEAHTITLGTVHFKDETVAEQAIKDVVEPFMKEHPEFVW